MRIKISPKNHCLFAELSLDWFGEDGGQTAGLKEQGEMKPCVEKGSRSSGGPWFKLKNFTWGRTDPGTGFEWFCELQLSFGGWAAPKTGLRVSKRKKMWRGGLVKGVGWRLSFHLTTELSSWGRRTEKGKFLCADDEDDEVWNHKWDDWVAAAVPWSSDVEAIKSL